MKQRKAIKAKKRRKDFEKKRDMRAIELKQILKQTRKNFGTFFPKSRRYPVTVQVSKPTPPRIQPMVVEKTGWWKRFTNWIKKVFGR